MFIFLSDYGISSQLKNHKFRILTSV